MKNSQWVMFMTIVRREVVRIFRIWRQMLLPPIITTVLYFIIFGSFLGSRIGLVEGFSYMAFIIPGLILMPNIANAYANVMSSFFMVKFQRSVEEMIVSPINSYTLVLGYAFGGVVRGLLTSVIVALAALFFVPFHVHSVGMILAFAFLTSFVFSLAGFANGVFATGWDDISLVPTFVLTPLTYLGGVFYSIEALPPFWQAVSHLNPVFYMIDGFRYGMLGISDTNVWIGLSILGVCSVVLFGFCVYLVEKGVGLKQ